MSATNAKRLAMYNKRKRVNQIALTLSLAAMGFGLVWLIWILLETLIQGVGGLTIATFTQMTPPPMAEEGGLANAIYGSLLMVGLAICVGTPIGVLAGTWLAEYGRGSKLANLIRFINDILLSAPSILIGLFVYVILVEPFRGYSGWAGGVALGIIAIPVIVRTTEDMLNLVPGPLREAGAALGAPPSVVITSVTWRAAKAGMVTGILLALARIAGETAPLLFTALNNQFWTSSMGEPMASLPVTIFKFAMSPYENWQKLAWAGVFIITIGVLLLNIAARVLFKEKH